MKSFVLSIIWMIAMSVSAFAQDSDSLYYARKDSLRTLDKDTANSMIQLGVIGDVFSGYNIDAVPVNENSEKHPNAMRFYHKDKLGNRVRQIVVLQDRWNNLPDDLKLWTEEGTDGTILSGLAGFKLAALTPKEYATAKYLGDIWGECFEVCYPKGFPHSEAERDTCANYPGYEFICYSDSVPLESIPTGWPTHRRYSREIMNFTDSTTMKSYQCAAPNIGTGQADYTKEASDGKYETRWMMCNPTENRYWIEKYKNYLGIEKEYITL